MINGLARDLYERYLAEQDPEAAEMLYRAYLSALQRPDCAEEPACQVVPFPQEKVSRGADSCAPAEEKLRGRELIAAWCACILGAWLVVYAIGYGLYLLVRMLWGR